MIILKVVFLILSFLVSASYADTLYLKNGRSIEGLIKREDERVLELEVNLGSVSFSKDEIGRIEKSTLEESNKIRRKWQKEQEDLKERIAQQRLEEENKPRKAEFLQDSQGILLAVVLNEKVEVSLVLDTGASIMMLRKDVVEKLGMDLDNVKPDMQAQLADGRKVDAKHIILESVKVQDSQAQNVDAAVLLDEAGITFGDGLLGMSFLNRFNFKVDQKEKKLILEKL